MKTFLIILEWAVGLIGMGSVVLTALVAMFIDNPNRVARFTSYQNIITDLPLYMLILVTGVFFVCVIGNFVTKEFHWPHIVGVVGLLGVMYAVMFFTAGIFS